MKRKLLLTVVMAAVLGMVWGCGGAAGEKGKGGPSVPEGGKADQNAPGTFCETKGEIPEGNKGALDENEETPEENGETPEDANLLWQRAALFGTVMEFSDGGCKISPTHIEGNLVYGAAPGHEEDYDQNEVVYGTDCRFWIANVDTITAKADYEAADVSDVKKQTELLFIGDYQEDGSLLAEKVYIYRGTEG